MAKSKVIAVEYDHDEIKQAIRIINAAGYKKKPFRKNWQHIPPKNDLKKQLVFEEEQDFKEWLEGKFC